MEEVRGSLVEALWALLRGMPTRLVHALQGSLYPPKPGRLVLSNHSNRPTDRGKKHGYQRAMRGMDESGAWELTHIHYNVYNNQQGPTI